MAEIFSSKIQDAHGAIVQININAGKAEGVSITFIDSQLNQVTFAVNPALMREFQMLPLRLERPFIYGFPDDEESEDCDG